MSCHVVGIFDVNCEANEVIDVYVDCALCVDWDIKDEVFVNPKGDVVGQDFFVWQVFWGLVHKEGRRDPIVA
jgi:hypothetical protein